MVTITAGVGSILWLQKLGASRKTRLERDAFYSRHIPKTHLVWDCGELNKKIERRDTICGRKTSSPTIFLELLCLAIFGIY